MTEEKESASATVVLAFVTGAAIGAIVALLLAPQSGVRTQRQVRGLAKKAGKGLRKVTEQAEGTWEDVIEQGRELLQDSQPMLAKAIEAGRKAMSRARQPGKKRK
jgi:gas vesicle protein